MNIWKVGTNWDGRNITDIFLRNHVVFFHPGDGNSADGIRQGDLVAIACGYSIVAVAMAVAQPGRLAGQPGFYLTAKDQERIDGCAEDIVGVRVQWLPGTLLRGKRVIWYAKQARFCSIQKPEIRRKVEEVWNGANEGTKANPFKIEARTSTLGGLLSGGRTVLYQIPIFQREYSWGPAEVERLLRDLLGSYYKEECMFTGTMQLSGPRLFDHHGACFQEVIDGQQRLTTSFLILKALHLLDPINKRIAALLGGERDWLETKVNSGGQQKALDEVMHEERVPRPADLGLNRFRDNLVQIYEFLSGELDPCGAESVEVGEKKREFDLRAFAEHFLDGMQFVVIETEAGLSKTIQIFNVINTTGLDLNGGDLFKVRMFEYLTDRHGAPKGCFEDISRVYERIEAENVERRRVFTSIHEILGIYQRLLCARHDLPLALVRAGTETFYERLFDTLLGNKVWTDYRTTAELDRRGAPLLALDDIGNLITLRHAADKEWHTPGAMSQKNRLARHLIQWSRYPSYWVLLILADYLSQEEMRMEPALRDEFCVALARVCVVYSVAYAKQINEIHGFFAEVSSEMFRSRDAENGRSLKDTIARLNAKAAARREDFHREISGYLASYLTAKHLICRLVEALHDGDGADLDGIFEQGYDIEHIRSYTDEDGEKVDVVRGEWGMKLHNLGNLMLLQYGLNRSVKNQAFLVKLDVYRKSKLRVALRIADQYSVATEWDLNAADKKLDHDAKLLTRYLFG